MKASLYFLVVLLPHLILAQSAEIKMLIREERRLEAQKILKVMSEENPEIHVCFFDLASAKLNDYQLILRVRLNAKDQKADSVVKLRGADMLLPDLVGTGLQWDWTGPNDRTLSYAIKDESWDAKAMEQVLEGKMPVTNVLSEKQQAFAKMCLDAGDGGELNWEGLRRYGVIHAWKSKRDVGEFNDVTVETWKLFEEGDVHMELLEISIKTDKDEKRTPQEVAAAFYAAAKEAGLGDPTVASKTEKVIEYFKPGK